MRETGIKASLVRALVPCVVILRLGLPVLARTRAIMGRITDFKLTQQDGDVGPAIEVLRSEEGEEMEVLRSLVLQWLRGAVWHTTSSERFQGILRAAAILPEPEIPDSERWSTSQGPKSYPYVRSLGGFSLFDFREFDPEQYSKDCWLSSWEEFVPYRPKWKEAIWIEIAIEKLGDSFVSGSDLLARWKSDEVGNRIMPKIEAAYFGPLPCAALKSAFRVCEGSPSLSAIQ